MPALRAALIASALALTAAVPAAAGAQATVEQGRTQPSYSYADAVREHVYVPAPIDSDADGRLDRVRVDIIRPRESGAGLKVPVIIDESPYYDNAGRGNESERKVYDAEGNVAKFPLFYDNYFVPRGYAVLNVDMLGTTRSDGCPDTGGPADVLGGKAVIDWLNGRAPAFRADGTAVAADWTTGNAAMIGKSYDGTLANAVAATGVEGLKTIVPISAISSWYDYVRSNGVLFATDYPAFLSNFVDTDPDAKCAAVRDRMSAEDGDETGDFNAFWTERDYIRGPLADVSKVSARVFAVHTVNDQNVTPNHLSNWWDALAGRNVPRKVWLGQYEHVDPFDFAGRRELWVDTLHRWFDHWLYGVQNGIMREPRADVQLGPDTWITQRDWPAPLALDVPFRPRAGGSLGLLGTWRHETATFTDVGMDQDEMVADVGTPNLGRAAFTTAPLPLDLRLSGAPVADLRVKLDAPTANITALLVDFGEDARVDWRRTGGIATLTEESCHGESTAADDACYRTTATNVTTRPLEIVSRGWIDVQNRDSLSNPAPLPAGQYGRVRWQTLPQEYVFKKGHRLGLVLAGTDTGYTVDTPTGATVTVDLTRSRITVPLVLTRLPSLAGDATRFRGPGKIELPEAGWRFF